MLEFKAQMPDHPASSADASAPISETNRLRIGTSRDLGAGRPGWLELDFLGQLAAFFSAMWSTDRAALQPIPVRVRDRR